MDRQYTVEQAENAAAARLKKAAGNPDQLVAEPTTVIPITVLREVGRSKSHVVLLRNLQAGSQ